MLYTKHIATYAVPFLFLGGGGIGALGVHYLKTNENFLRNLYPNFLKKKQTISDIFESKVTDYEKKHNSKIILVIDEFDKFPNSIKNRSIAFNQKGYEKFLYLFWHCRWNKKCIDFIFDTHGGEYRVATTMIGHINSYEYNTRGYVPCRSFSAGSKLLFACNELNISKSALLSPFDPQMSNSISNKRISTNIIKKINDSIADVEFAKQCDYDNYETTRQILKNRDYNDKQIEQICDEFISGKYLHSKIFTVNDLQTMGIIFNQNIPEEIDVIYGMYMKIRNMHNC